MRTRNDTTKDELREMLELLTSGHSARLVALVELEKKLAETEAEAQKVREKSKEDEVHLAVGGIVVGVVGTLVVQWFFF
jgi:hypothetical protein